MYIIAMGDRNDVYHLAVRNDGSGESYASVCGLYQLVRFDGIRYLVVEEPPQYWRLCKRCQALTETK